jgi:hypothetical protein
MYAAPPFTRATPTHSVILQSSDMDVAAVGEQLTARKAELTKQMA